MEQQERTLSASGIKCIETCSWLYWTQYVCKVPQKTNEGALRGTIVHLIFELLLNPKHKKHFSRIHATQSVPASPAIDRLLLKLLKKEKILTVGNYKLCCDMILVGLNTDFFGVGGKVEKPEFRFEFSNENPRYIIRGYIDKMFVYKNGKLKIVDYKSSKSKFSGDDLTANVQAMTYSLIGYKLLEAKDVSVDFIFLRYPRAPIQSLTFTREQLHGFEQYLGYMFQWVNQLTELEAKSNFAINNQKNRWICKAGAWECPYMRPFQYFALVDNATNKILRTALSSDDLKPAPEQDARVELRFYAGCPAHEGIGAPDEL